MGLSPAGFGLWGSVEEVTAIPGTKGQSPAQHVLPSPLDGLARPAASSFPALCWEHGQGPATLLGKHRSGEHASPPRGSQAIPEVICCSIPRALPAEGDSPLLPLLTQHFAGGGLKKGPSGSFLLLANNIIPCETKKLPGRSRWHPTSSSTGVHGPPLRLQCPFQTAREQG